jgi:hypothetical protein
MINRFNVPVGAQQAAPQLATMSALPASRRFLSVPSVLNSSLYD